MEQDDSGFGLGPVGISGMYRARTQTQISNLHPGYFQSTSLSEQLTFESDCARHCLGAYPPRVGSIVVFISQVKEMRVREGQ